MKEDIDTIVTYELLSQAMKNIGFDKEQIENTINECRKMKKWFSKILKKLNSTVIEPKVDQKPLCAIEEELPDEERPFHEGFPV